MAHGSRGARDRHEGGRAGGRRPQPLEPRAMSHEPFTINRRLINELFDYILYVLDIPKTYLTFSGRYWPHIQDFQDFIRRIGGICRRPSLRHFQSFGFSFFEIRNKHDFRKMSQRGFLIRFFLLFLSILMSHKEIVGFGARGHVRKSRNHRNDSFWVLP